MRTRTPIEKVTRYATTVDTMNDAFVFVMDHIDKLGGEPSVQIHPCWGVDRPEAAHEPEGTAHYHAVVEGCIEMKEQEE